MAREIREFQFTIPVGTAESLPLEMNMTFPTRIVNMLQITVPPGPLGYMGFRIAAAGNPIIPYNDGGWIVTNDEKIEWPLEDYIDSGAWQIQGYNNGIYDHTVYVRFLLSLTQGSDTSMPTVINSSQLSSS